MRLKMTAISLFTRICLDQRFLKIHGILKKSASEGISVDQEFVGCYNNSNAQGVPLAEIGACLNPRT